MRPVKLSCAFNAIMSVQTAFLRYFIGPLRSFNGRGTDIGHNPIQNIYQCMDSIVDIQRSSQCPMDCPYIDSVRALMSEVTLDHLGIDLSSVQQLRHMQCMTVAHTANFDIAIFMIPKGQRLPVHDHPNMSVISKVVEGALRVRSFSSVSSAKEDGRTVRLEEFCTKQSNDAAWLLSPTVGNFHEFTAESACVIFDVLLPPYEYPHRPCNYYEVTDYHRDEHSAASDDSLHDDSLRKPLFRLNMIPERTVAREMDLPYSVGYKGIRPITRNRLS